jgi:hypothetical protein
MGAVLRSRFLVGAVGGNGVFKCFVSNIVIYLAWQATIDRAEIIDLMSDPSYTFSNRRLNCIRSILIAIVNFPCYCLSL